MKPNVLFIIEITQQLDGWLGYKKKTNKKNWIPKNISLPTGPACEFLLSPLYVVMTRKTSLCRLRCPVRSFTDISIIKKIFLVCGGNLLPLGHIRGIVLSRFY